MLGGLKKVLPIILIFPLLLLDIVLAFDIYKKYEKTNIYPAASTFEKEKTPVSEVAGVKAEKITVTAPISPSTTPTITSTLTSSPTPSPSQAPTTPPQALDLLQQINNFRKDLGLAPFTASSETCFFANLRSHEISVSFNHDGFTSRLNARTLPYPSFSEVAENISMNSDSNQVIANWISSDIHKNNLQKNVPYACIVKNGNYYVFEAWKP